MSKKDGGTAHQQAMLESALAKNKPKAATPKPVIPPINPPTPLQEIPFLPPGPTKDIWASIFGIDALLSWTVVGCLVPGLFLAVGIGMLTVDWFPHNLLISQLAFSLAAFLSVAKIIAHAKETRGSVPRRMTFAVVMTSGALILWGGFCWNVQRHKGDSGSELLNFQVKVTKNIIFPPTVGQQFRIDTHFQNMGTHVLRLRSKSAVMVIDGTIPYFSISPSDQYAMQDKVWKDFYGPHDDLGSQKPVPPFMDSPPLEEEWFTDLGHIATQQEYDDFNQKNGKLIIASLVKIEWREGENGVLHGYDVCKFTAGNVEVVHNCNSHNGPYTPKTP